MPEPTQTISTHYRGEQIEIPATIADVRAFIHPDKRAAFTRAAEETLAEDLPEVLMDWVWNHIADDPDVQAAIDRLAERGNAQDAA